jgi:hypothetical protein
MRSNGKTAHSAKNKHALARKPHRQLVTVLGPLTAGSLKNILWETLNDIRTNQMLPNRGDAIASQAREILRTVKTQLQIASAARRGLPTDIIDFSEK